MVLVETQRSILNLPDQVEALPAPQREIFNRIFQIRRTSVPLVFASEQARLALAIKFRADPALLLQREALRVTNIVWGESTLFNPLRANRPLQSGSSEQAAEAVRLLEERNPKDRCDFCLYPDHTPGDPFGDIRGTACITRANVAPYCGLHSVVFNPRVHHPLSLTGADIADLISTGVRWIKAAHRYAKHELRIDDPEYPFIGMNNLPRSGASVFHPHLQVLLEAGEPLAGMANLANRMSDYQWLNGGRPYLADLVECLMPLGLVERVEAANAIFNPAPKKESEMIIVADDLEGLPNGSLSAAVAKVIEWWKVIGITSFNMAIYMPKLGASLQDGPWYQLKPFVRMVSRGMEGHRISDIGVMEMYGSPVVASDPFKLADSFRSYSLVPTK